MKYKGTITYEDGSKEEFEGYELIENDGGRIFMYKDKDDLEVYRSFKLISLYSIRSIDVQSYGITDEERKKRRKTLKEREKQEENEIHENMLI